MSSDLNAIPDLGFSNALVFYIDWRWFLDPVKINICGVSGLHIFKYPTISDQHSCDSLWELLQIDNYPDNPFGVNGLIFFLVVFLLFHCRYKLIGKFSCGGMWLNAPIFLQRQVDGGNVALGSHIEVRDFMLKIFYFLSIFCSFFCFKVDLFNF
jgi:hypothetical protein